MKRKTIPILKMEKNRVRRNYTGGALLNRYAGLEEIDDEKPEEWLCSTVEASNPGLPEIPMEGLSWSIIEGEKYLFKEILESNPEYYLGAGEYKPLTFLAKWLDSSIRLHMQAHPTRDFSRKYLGCDYGKFEAYYVLKIRDNVKQPYIRLGFQNRNISKDMWTEIVKNQDIAKMDLCFDKIPIKEGDVIYIPGGMPHAIGEGIFMLEMMEPSDLVVRCEFEREGIIVPEKARFMGRGLEFCMDIFDYTYKPKELVQKEYFLKPLIIEENSDYRIEELVPPEIAGCFETKRITISGAAEIPIGSRYGAVLGTKGTGKISSGDVQYRIKPLDDFFIASSAESMKIKPDGIMMEVCLIQPVNG